jgi:hypothetical protein
VQWVNRINYDPTYTSEALLERAYVLGPKIAELKKTVRQPEESMAPAAWEALSEKLQRLEAQMRAITDVLGEREKRARREGMISPSRTLFRKSGTTPAPLSAGSSYPPGSTPSTSTADEAWDPFRDC